LGPMCRTADDCGLVLEAIAGPDPSDPTATGRTFRHAPPPGGRRKGPPRRWRLGVLKDAATKAHPEVARNFETSLGAVREFADVTPDLVLPDLPFAEAARTIILAEAGSAFEDFVDSGAAHELTAPEDRIGGYSRIAVLAKDYIRALRLRRKMVNAFDEFLRPFDAVVHPARPSPANPIDRPFREAWPGVEPGPALAGAENICGTPGISVPNGFAAAGLPTGLQISARAFDEGVLLAIAQEFQRRTDWHTRRPPLEP